MNIIALGDIHGNTKWKQIVENQLEAGFTDKIVFVGDYFDSNEGISAADQISNFQEIIAFKKAHTAQVVLLVGNHDYQYLRSSENHYSGYQPLAHMDIAEQLDRALYDSLLQMCYENGKYLFSHAGVTKMWCNDFEIDMTNVVQSINDLFRYKPRSFEIRHGNAYGDHPSNSPIWVRPNSLMIDAIDGYVQVVGHTQQAMIVITKKLILIDTLGLSGDYLKIIDGKPYAL